MTNESMENICVDVVPKDRYRNLDGRGCTLTFPATKSAMIDALEIAGVPYGSGDYYLLPNHRTPDHLHRYLQTGILNPTMGELNLLAERVNLLDPDYERRMIPCISEIRGSSDITDLINATYNTDKFFLTFARSKEEMGEVCIGGGFIEELDTLPEWLVDCIDRKKLGRAWLRQENAIRIGECCVFPVEKGWNAVYLRDTEAAERGVRWAPSDPMLRVRLATDQYDDPVRGLLTLPYNEWELDRALKEVGASGAGDVSIAEAQSKITALESTLRGYSDLEKANELAAAVAGFDDDAVRKYKAVYDALQPGTVDQAIEAARGLDRYEVIPLPPQEGKERLLRQGYTETLWGLVGDNGTHRQERTIARRLDSTAVNLLREVYPSGTPVVLVAMEGEDDMPPGLLGKVELVDDAGQVHVRWQNGRSLALIPGVDIYSKTELPNIQYRQMIESRYPPGAHIRIESTQRQQVREGTTGIVTKVDEFADIHVETDDGKELFLQEHADRFIMAPAPEELAALREEYPAGSQVEIRHMQSVDLPQPTIRATVLEIDGWGLIQAETEGLERYAVNPVLDQVRPAPQQEQDTKDNHKLDLEGGPSM